MYEFEPIFRMVGKFNVLIILNEERGHLLHILSDLFHISQSTFDSHYRSRKCRHSKLNPVLIADRIDKLFH